MITPQQRQAAETVIMNFRKTKSPYAICREILEKSQCDLLLFEAADVLKRSVVNEWDILQDDDKLMLRQYLLNYVLHREMQPYVQAKILQVVAIMVKRTSLADAGVERTALLDEMGTMIFSGDARRQYLACRILYTIMQEFLTTIKSDDTGLTFEEHFKVKKQFELFDLKKIFVMVATATNLLIDTIDLTNQESVYLLTEFVTIIEQILLWGYVSPLLPKRLISVLESNNKIEQNPPLRLTIQWESIITSPERIKLFFTLYWKVRDLDGLQQKALTCLVQLSTLNGPLIDSQLARTAFISNYLTHFLQLLSK